MEIIVAVISAGILMGILDFIWLGFVAKKVYYEELGSLLRDKPNMGAALLFYVIYVVGTAVFVILPAVEKESWLFALGMGALLGFMCYSTYDLTNLATLKNFSKKVVAIDLAWGAFITAVVAAGSTALTLWLTK